MTRWTNRLDANHGIIQAHVSLQHASEHAAVLYWHGAEPAALERHRGYMMGHLRKAAEALGFDLVERKPKNASRRGLALAETPEGDHA